MDIKITGSVFAGNDKGNDHKKLEGIISLPDDEAQRLIDLKVAEAVNTEPQQIKTPVEKPYKNMNCEEQTVKINAETDLTTLESMKEDTKKTILPVLEDRIKTLSGGSGEGQNSSNESGQNLTGESQGSKETGEGGE